MMYRKTLDYIREHQLIAPGDRVIVGLSGGADSVCLLVILNELKKEFNMELFAVHIHHGLRGSEADRDSRYAQELSESLGVPFVCVHVKAAEYAKEHGMSEEEAGRYLRYHILEQERIRVNGTRIAVAHHAGDQVETVLYNLFRGSGLKGLGGMRPERGVIIRPLLFAEKREILEFLEERGISHCEDSTNASGDYVRNRLRGEIIPAVTERINRNACGNVLRAAEAAYEADAYLEKVAKRLIEESAMRKMKTAESGGDESSGQEVKAIAMPVSILLENDDIIRRYVIRLMISEMSRSLKDITSTHVKDTAGLLHSTVGHRIDLPGGLYAERSYEELWLKREADKEEKQLPKLQTTVFSYEKGQEFPKNGYTKWFDYDKINNALCVRFRETGDYIMLAGGGKKTVKAFMIDEKIPKEERDRIPLVADGSHILWIIGYRISEYYKITGNTHTVIQIQINGGKK